MSYKIATQGALNAVTNLSSTGPVHINPSDGYCPTKAKILKYWDHSGIDGGEDNQCIDINSVHYADRRNRMFFDFETTSSSPGNYTFTAGRQGKGFDQEAPIRIGVSGHILAQEGYSTTFNFEIPPHQKNFQTSIHYTGSYGAVIVDSWSPKEDENNIYFVTIGV